ncbi:MAG: hypothetical protein JJE45_00420 [Prolixibacteraceae bacterium]|nr:hypothetical protein [Prolixibacteraceae bacterium]
MEDMYKEHKLRYERIGVSHPQSSFLIEPCYSMDRIEKIPLRTKVLKIIKKILFVSSVILVLLTVLIGGSVLVSLYCPTFIGYWWLFSFLMGWVAANILFD